jgi:fructokinase
MENIPVIYCIGEALIDFIPAPAEAFAQGVAREMREALLPMPGGAPANTAVAAAKLGANAALIAAVGDDGFGRQLIGIVDGYGVDTSLMMTTRAACTTLAFVTLTAEGEREFTFARKPGADMLLSEDALPEGLFKAGDVLHFGSLGLAPDSASKEAHRKAIAAASSAGALASFDPNVRLSLWDDPAVLRDTIFEFLPAADIFKVSSDETPFIFGTDDEGDAAAACFECGVKLFFVTRGKDGAAAYTPGFSVEVPGREVRAVDTTGAGDTFNGAMLSRFAGRPEGADVDPEFLKSVVRFANHAGSITVTRRGGMAGSPSLAEMAGNVRIL